MNNVVLALDGSPESIEAANFLCRLPFRNRPNVTVVTALVDTPFELVPTDSGLQLREAEKTSARTAFAGIEGQLGKLSQSLEHVIERGHPNHLINDVARERDADLIVLGARGHNALYRTLLGSTADHVATHAKTSVVIVRPDGEGKFAGPDEPFRVLLAYDGSDEARVAFEELRSFDWNAEQADFLVAYMLVRPKLVPEDVVYDPGEIEKAEAFLQDLIAPWSQAFSVKPTVKETREIGSGLEDLVMTEKRNLLFVGGTGKSALQRFFLGSSSRHLLHHAECPIWVARQKRHA